jgi:hypothetical protein
VKRLFLCAAAVSLLWGQAGKPVPQRRLPARGSRLYTAILVSSDVTGWTFDFPAAPQGKTVVPVSLYFQGEPSVQQDYQIIDGEIWLRGCCYPPLAQVLPFPLVLEYKLK